MTKTFTNLEKIGIPTLIITALVFMGVGTMIANNHPYSPYAQFWYFTGASWLFALIIYYVLKLTICLGCNNPKEKEQGGELG
jgi:hypothetical protein